MKATRPKSAPHREAATAAYPWGQNDLICREKFDAHGELQERFFPLSDAGGNIVGIAPDAEESLDRLITYDPYGSPTGAGDFQHLFGGYYYDPSTGLYLVRNRVYHPQLGRWLTKDPLGMVDGPNLYEYCAGDPVNFTDPMGGWIESAWDAFSLTVGYASYQHNLAEGNYGWAMVDAIGIAADLTALAIPLLPGGASVAIKGARVGQAVRSIDRFSDVVKAGDFGANAYQSYDSYQRGDFWGATLGAAGVGVRAIQGSFVLPRRYHSLNARWGTPDYPGVENYDDWFAFWNTRTSEAWPLRVKNPKVLGPKYLPGIIIGERPRTIEYLDAAAHESFHAFILKHLPSIADAGKLRIGKVPIGAPFKYLEEVAAYSVGHLRVGRLHGVIASPLEVLLSKSLDKDEKGVVVGLGVIAAGAAGGWWAYEHSR